jgi:hypothetical protein
MRDQSRYAIAFFIVLAAFTLGVLNGLRFGFLHCRHRCVWCLQPMEGRHD